ncbi:hypothetical protein F5Y16DRAFT_370390 [Xylariaceae sp. FL0255]|nr:hypothetical protein F5Y16DRAFT_370390 [Xylariaceae sp. FL0255]
MQSLYSDMMDSFSNPVTLDRAHFDTLMRRANCNPDFQTQDAISANGAAVSISKVEYDSLLVAARQFANLKRTLIEAGITETQIATLVQDENGSIPQTPTYPTATKTPYSRGTSDVGGARLNQMSHHPASSFVFDTAHAAPVKNGSGTRSYIPSSYYNGRPYEDQLAWAESEPLRDSLTPSLSGDGHAETHDHGSFHQPHNARPPIYPRICNRTIALCGLPKGTTYEDVTSVVRGGLLVDIFVRYAEHMALVSFLREEDAVRFYEYVRKNDLYVKHKRVFIKWADRHFALPGHVAGKIAAGHTRNMIIRRCGPNHTEASIRDDLDHIHNLVVISVEFIGGSCYIKTNSVHNAMYARTCMTSRAKYKSSKIEWDVDECDQPLPAVQKMPPQPPSSQGASTKAPTVKARNRFDLLRLDDEDNGSDDRFDTSSEMPSTVGVTA